MLVLVLANNDDNNDAVALGRILHSLVVFVAAVVERRRLPAVLLTATIDDRDGADDRNNANGRCRRNSSSGVIVIRDTKIVSQSVDITRLK